MKSYRKYLFWVFWAAMVVVTIVIYVRYDTNSDFIGLVETRTHVLSVQESGRAAAVNVGPGDAVAAGQVLVALDTSDLDAEKAILEDELRGIEARLGADRARFGLEYDNQATRSAADTLNMDLKRTDLVEKTAELESISSEIARLKAAQDAGLGRSDELSDLIIRRDTLSRVIAAQRAVLSARPTGARSESGVDRERVVESMLGDSLARVNEIKVSLALVESRRALRTIVAPADGRVVALLVRPGDTVERYLPVVTIEEGLAEYIDVYVPETSDQMPLVGGRVNLYPHRRSAANAVGKIVAIDPGYSMIPERLAFQGRLYWARKFRVQIDNAHQLMPGEAVRVELVDGTIGVTEAIAYALDQGSLPADGGVAPAGVVPVSVEQAALSAITNVPAPGFRGSFEPSGLIWLADIERFLIVSDDTGDGASRHAPWLFLMDRNGVVEPRPAVLSGVAAVNDLEAITSAPDGTIYVLSSNNLNRKGLRKPVRQQLLRVSRQGRSFTVTGHVALFDAISASGDAGVTSALGLGRSASGGQLELNIEGAAWYDGGILIGLKQPVGDDGAIIWRLDRPDALIDSGRLEPGQLSVFATVDLGSFMGRRAAISDLARSADGTIWVASTIPSAPDSAQLGRVFRLEPAVGGKARAIEAAVFPGMKPEGLCQADAGSMLVVFDTGNAPAKYYVVKWSR